jgi:hypothetical protein
LERAEKADFRPIAVISHFEIHKNHWSKSEKIKDGLNNFRKKVMEEI